MTKTINLLEQLKCSAILHKQEFAAWAHLSDTDLAKLLANSDPTYLVGMFHRAGFIDNKAREWDFLQVKVPVVENLDKKVLKAVGKAGENLNMEDWHCGTTHCRAGWAITLAGEEGKKLESVLGSKLAGRYIYEASTGRVAPRFFVSKETALKEIKRCASIN